MNGLEGTPLELINTLQRRYDVLQCLYDEDRTKRELVETLDVSRATVDRGVRELESMGLIEYASGCYTLSVFGRLVREGYEMALRRFRDIGRAEEVLTALPRRADVDISIVRDAEVVLSSEPAPHRPSTRVSELVSKAESLRGLARAHTTPGAANIIYRRITQEEADVELVFEKEMYDYLESELGTKLREMFPTGRFQPHTIDRVPFGLFTIDDGKTRRTCLLGYDSDLILKGVLVNDSQRALEWADSLFEQYKREATPIRESP